jgi:subfamily B ATP-binding cassette protein MsbA
VRPPSLGALHDVAQVSTHLRLLTLAVLRSGADSTIQHSLTMAPDSSLTSSAMAFATARARAFARAHWAFLGLFTATSLARTACTIAVVFLIRDFLTGVLMTPQGISLWLTNAVGQTAALGVVAALLFAVFLASAVFAYASQISQQRLVRGFELELMQALITHLLRLPVAFFNQRHRGDLVESIRLDVGKTRIAVAAMADIFVFGAQGLAYAGSAIVISPRLVLVSLPILLLAILPSRWFVKQIRRRALKLRQHGYRLTDLLLQLMEGVRMVKVYGGEEAETRNSIATARRYFDHMIGAARVRALSEVLLETAGGLSVVVVTIVGGFEVLAGRLTVPSLIASLVALRAAHGPLSNCFSRFMEIQSNMASADRIRILLATEPELRDRVDAIPFPGALESLEFANVSFAYAGGSRVLADVSFEVRAGQHVGIVGPSGAGKTTLTSLIARFYDPTGGRILLNGTDLRDYRTADLYRHLSLVTQDLFLFSTTVRENIRYGCPGISDADVERAAMAAEIHDDILKLPKGYDTVLGIGGRLLSGGQIQRVNIARALVKNAPIVILDEATSNLDSIAETKIQLALDRLMGGRTTFTIAHRLSTLRNADLILVIDGGRCIASGHHEGLLARCALYRDLWSAQQSDPPTLNPSSEPAQRRMPTNAVV